ncbi:MAG: hypothetical protein AB7P17_12755 [Nitrospirales bacterium]
MENEDPVRPFYYIVAFWGSTYRRHFLQLCLPSLLAPGNIPFLLGKRPSRFLISTTHQDWAALSTDPLFSRLQTFVEPVFLELRREVPDFLKTVVQEKMRRSSSESIERNRSVDCPLSPLDIATPEVFEELQALGREMGVELTDHHHYAVRILFMSAGHKAAASQAHHDQAYGIFLAPDMVLSDGAVAHLHQLAQSGKKVVMVSACRFSLEDGIREFHNSGLMASAEALILPPRKLVEMVFGCLHPETACFEFDSPLFSNPATSAFWKVSGDEGVLLHSFFWAPLLVDYVGIDRHHGDYFDAGGTTDGKYIAMHFDFNRDVSPVTDSDEIFLASFTPRGEYAYSVRAGILKQIPGLRMHYKTFLIRRTLYGPMGDPMKRSLYRWPVRLHSQSLSLEWKEVEQRADQIVKRALKVPGVWGRTANTVLWLKSLCAGPNLSGRIRNVGGYLIGKISPQTRTWLKRILGQWGMGKRS